MEISFKSKKIERICTDFGEASRQHGRDMATIIHQRVKELRATDSVDTIIHFGIGRCHQLKGKRNDQFALDLRHPYRLIFKPDSLTTVRILEIVDYH